MSQEKVNRYKEYKKNRKEILAKEKRKQRIEKAAAYAVIGVFCAGVVGAIGVTVWNQHKAALAARPNYKSESYIVGDMNGILEDPTEEESSKPESGEDSSEESSSEETASEEASEEASAEESSEESSSDTAGTSEE